MLLSDSHRVWWGYEQGRMVDALALRGDEGRGVPAICFGEVASNLWSGGFRMGQPLSSNVDKLGG